jgi:membrane protein YqaA with SNARE-associated domain
MTSGLFLSTFLVCFASGFVPLVNAEVYLLSVSAVSPPGTVTSLVVASTLGQMSSKVIVYFAGRGVLKLPLSPHYEKKLAEVRERMEKHRTREGLLIFVSALSGVPPFYVVSVVAGLLKFDVVRFFSLGSTGRLLRFTVIVAFPQLAKSMIK